MTSKPEMCRYPECGKVYASRAGRNAHEKRVHGALYVDGRTETAARQYVNGLKSNGLEPGGIKKNQVSIKEINFNEEKFKMAKEKLDGKKDDSEKNFECSKCGYEFDEKTKFCPACGQEFA